MSEENKLTVRYCDSSLAARFGAGEFKIGTSLALDYERRGLAKIIGRRPDANPSLPEPDTSFSIMPEEQFKTKITYICSTYVDTMIKKVGGKLGFGVEVFTPTLFSLPRLLQSELILLEYFSKGFSSNQWNQLLGVLFQKRIPYVLRVIDHPRDKTFPNLLTHSKLVIFANKRIFDETSDLYGECFNEWWVEGKEVDPYAFWRQIDKIVNPPEEDSPLACLNDPDPLESHEAKSITLEDLQKMEEMLPLDPEMKEFQSPFTKNVTPSVKKTISKRKKS